MPTPGSSGAPIVDDETGAVVGVILGSRMDYGRVEGLTAWGVPAEAIYEASQTGLSANLSLSRFSFSFFPSEQMFRLPGLPILEEEQ